jgi:hypothetical protein
MADEVSHLGLEHASRPCADVGVIREELCDIEIRVTPVMRRPGDLQVRFVSQGKRMHRFDERLARMERRPDLVEP